MAGGSLIRNRAMVLSRFRAIEAMSTAWNSASASARESATSVRLCDAATGAQKPDGLLKRHDGRKSNAMLDRHIDGG